MRIVGRILPHRIDRGTANMAIDEALLEDVATDRSCAFIRTYEWAAPTLTLGYFQHLSDARSDPRFQTVPIVRRATGGGALWHDREITYSVVIPAEHPCARQAQSLYRVIHQAIGCVIEERGLEVSRRGGRSDEPGAMPRGLALPHSDRPFLCFADRDSEDLVSDGVKIVGSAQRRRAGAILQHGSVLLSGSRLTPELRGVTDLLGDSVSEPPHLWAHDITLAIILSLELASQASEVSEKIRCRAIELETSIYANPGWTARR